MIILTQNGNVFIQGKVLRPVVSIDLQKSGYKIIKSDGSGEADYILTK